MARRQLPKLFAAVLSALALATAAHAQTPDAQLEDALRQTGMSFVAGKNGEIDVTCPLLTGTNSVVHVRTQTEESKGKQVRRLFAQFHSAPKPYSDEQTRAFFALSDRYEYGGVMIRTMRDGQSYAFYTVLVDAQADGELLGNAIRYVARTADEIRRSVKLPATAAASGPSVEDLLGGDRTANPVVGAWKFADSKGSYVLLTFRPDGGYVMAFFGADGSPGASFKGRYTAVNNNVTMTPEAGSGDRRRWVVERVEGDRLTLGIAGQDNLHIPFERVR